MRVVPTLSLWKDLETRGVHRCTLIDCFMSAVLEDGCLFVLGAVCEELLWQFSQLFARNMAIDSFAQQHSASVNIDSICGVKHWCFLPSWCAFCLTTRARSANLWMAWKVWLRSTHTQGACSKLTPCDRTVRVVGTPKKIERASSTCCASSVHVFKQPLEFSPNKMKGPNQSWQLTSGNRKRPWSCLPPLSIKSGLLLASQTRPLGIFSALSRSRVSGSDCATWSLSHIQFVFVGLFVRTRLMTVASWSVLRSADCRWCEARVCRAWQPCKRWSRAISSCCTAAVWTLEARVELIKPFGVSIQFVLWTHAVHLLLAFGRHLLSRRVPWIVALPRSFFVCCCQRSVPDYLLCGFTCLLVVFVHFSAESWLCLVAFLTRTVVVQPSVEWLSVVVVPWARVKAWILRCVRRTSLHVWRGWKVARLHRELPFVKRGTLKRKVTKYSPRRQWAAQIVQCSAREAARCSRGIIHQGSRQRRGQFGLHARLACLALRRLGDRWGDQTIHQERAAEEVTLAGGQEEPLGPLRWSAGLLLGERARESEGKQREASRLGRLSGQTKSCFVNWPQACLDRTAVSGWTSTTPMAAATAKGQRFALKHPQAKPWHCLEHNSILASWWAMRSAWKTRILGPVFAGAWHQSVGRFFLALLKTSGCPNSTPPLDFGICNLTEAKLRDNRGSDMARLKRTSLVLWHSSIPTQNGPKLPQSFTCFSTAPPRPSQRGRPLRGLSVLTATRFFWQTFQCVEHSRAHALLFTRCAQFVWTVGSLRSRTLTHICPCSFTWQHYVTSSGTLRNVRRWVDMAVNVSPMCTMRVCWHSLLNAGTQARDLLGDVRYRGFLFLFRVPIGYCNKACVYRQRVRRIRTCLSHGEHTRWLSHVAHNVNVLSSRKNTKIIDEMDMFIKSLPYQVIEKSTWS